MKKLFCILRLIGSFSRNENKIFISPFLPIIIIFLLLAFPVFAEELPFLTNQNGVQTTQFESSDEIYIEGFCLPANQESGKIYIMSDKTWQIGDKLSDISGGIETFTNSSDGRIPRTKIWNKPPYPGTFDVIIDTNNNLKLEDYEKQCVIGITGAGFTVGNPAPPPPPAVITPPSPPPVSTPPPSPPVSTKPSVIFSLDEDVVTKSLANIRKSPGGTLIGTQEKGALGVVIGGPVQESVDGTYFWCWNINFENDPDGWVAASMLKSAPKPVPVEEVVVEKNTAEPLADTATTTATTTTNEISQQETAPEKMTAQVSDTDTGFNLNPFMSSIIIGLALFFGLICSSFIIAWALRRN